MSHPFLDTTRSGISLAGEAQPGLAPWIKSMVAQNGKNLAGMPKGSMILKAATGRNHGTEQNSWTDDSFTSFEVENADKAGLRRLSAILPNGYAVLGVHEGRVYLHATYSIGD